MGKSTVVELRSPRVRICSARELTGELIRLLALVRKREGRSRLGDLGESSPRVQMPPAKVQ